MTDSTRGLTRRQMLAGSAALLLTPLHAAESGTALDTYLEGLSTWSAEFMQVTEDERGRRQGEGAGRLQIVRPGKFRWETSAKRGEPPMQVMVADGCNLWFLDTDLEQATVEPQADALPQSPALLLAGGAELRAAFNVTSDGRRDGQDWVKVQPRQAESDYREALFAFRGRELSRLVIVNKLGQRSVLTFSNVRRNGAIDAAVMRFTPPAGADLIGKPAGTC